MTEQPGPNWKGLFGTEQALTNGEIILADDDYLRLMITDPAAQTVEGYGRLMPQIPLQKPELDALVAYIKSLGKSS